MPGAGHNLPQEAPEIVADADLRLIESHGRLICVRIVRSSGGAPEAVADEVGTGLRPISPDVMANRGPAPVLVLIGNDHDR